MQDEKIFDAQGNILKAGGLVVREHDGKRYAALVYRDYYDDWTFPKGYVESIETMEEAAAREVGEEVGVAVVIEKILPPIEYMSKKGQRFNTFMYLMRPKQDHELSPYPVEIDKAEWILFEEIPERLSYDNLRDWFAAVMEKLN